MVAEREKWDAKRYMAFMRHGCGRGGAGLDEEEDVDEEEGFDSV